MNVFDTKTNYESEKIKAKQFFANLIFSLHSVCGRHQKFRLGPKFINKMKIWLERYLSEKSALRTE